MTNQSPFAILGIAATLEPGEVKRAYFKKLPLYPPQTDPQGFRRLRAAYEALQRPAGLITAYFEAPLDIEAEAATYRQRFEARLAAARSQPSRTESRGRQFSELVSPLSFEEAVRRFA
jgi:hypothetical protein